MKVTAQKKSAAKSPGKHEKSSKIKKQMAVRVPKDFVFLLMDHMVSDLARSERASGDGPVLGDPDIDLSEVITAIRSRNIHQLLQATKPFSAQSISGKWSHKPEIAFALYQLHTLLKKFPLSGTECRQAAYQTFLDYEAHCKTFNEQNCRAILALSERHPDYLGIIEDIREDIRCCIGDQPPMPKILDGVRHGPGTAIGLNNPMVTSYFKWSSLPYTVSPKALPLAREAIERDQRWLSFLIHSYRRSVGNIYEPIDMTLFWSYVFRVVDYCEYSTVPKSAETDRSIGIEPSMNVFLQLGVDSVIRRRLLHRWNINLNTQSVNQELARDSSITDEDATIDLRGASDCVSLMACYLLLPEAWFGLLLDLRSEKIRIDDRFEGQERFIPLQKMSAMGNGFTFVLETLIFAAISRVTMRRAKVKGNLAVYGDDIIVPRQIAHQVITNLGYFGFDTNVDKTFISGPFRESCGVDCLKGTNIRPLFLKNQVKDVTDIWYISNFLFQLERRLPDLWEISFDKTRTWLYTFIPRFFADVKGPASESLDTHLFVERSRYDRHGVCKHWALTPCVITFNDRTDDWYFRRLMVDLKPRAFNCQQFLRTCFVNRLLGIPNKLRDGCFEGGTIDNINPRLPSGFDITLRDVYEYNLSIRRVWRK